MDERELLELALTAVEACEADQAEAFAMEGERATTRFANNQIHQNMAERSRQLSVRAVMGKRIGVATGIVNNAEEAKGVAARAVELAKVSGELEDFVSLPGPTTIAEAPAGAAKDVVECTAADRGEAVAKALAIATGRHLVAAGSLATDYSIIALANSLGVKAARSATNATFHLVMQGEDSGGYAAAEGKALADTRVAETAEKAAEKADMGRHPRAVEAAPMTVVFEPVAAAEMLSFLGFAGFNALAYQEQQAFTCDSLHKQVGVEMLDIVDDGLDPRTYVAPFDFEGVAKQRVELISKGVVSGLVYDSYTAGREKPARESTGHAGPAPNTWGPVPWNMIVEPRTGSMEELIGQVERGLLVSRIHYLNFVHQRQMILTGMTREGTFLIENGKIVGGVRNLRFTEHFVESLGRIAAIGGQGELHGMVWTPPLVIDGFEFTSGTGF
jgi:predicted Zn-dependent protease